MSSRRIALIIVAAVCLGLGIGVSQLVRNYELPCPAGYSDLLGPTYDAATHQFRSWVCVDPNGNVIFPMVSPSLPTIMGTTAKVNLLAPVNIPLNTQTLILTENVTFPAGGPYRAIVSYSAFMTSGGNVCAAEVYETTNHTATDALATSMQNANAVGYIALTGSEVTTRTYAGGSTATFTLQGDCNGGGGVSVTPTFDPALSFAFSPAENTHLSVTPVLSN